jgi:hypothetical protein
MSRTTTIGFLAALALGITVSTVHGQRTQVAQAPTVTPMCNETHSLPDQGQCVGTNCVHFGSTDRVSGPTFPWACRRAA